MKFIFVPFIILILGIYFNKIILSLFLVVFFCSLVVVDFSLLDSLILLKELLFKNLEIEYLLCYDDFHKAYNIYICFFLFLLGIFITLMKNSGFLHVYSLYFMNYIKTRKGTEISSLILSKFLFIDDYLSSLSVGTIITPLADKNNLSRIKLAFLVDSMSAPLVLLCPISSWSAAILGFLKKSGISLNILDNTLILVNPSEIYFCIFPFIFYSFVLILGIWVIVLFNINLKLFDNKNSEIKLDINYNKYNVIFLELINKRNSLFYFFSPFLFFFLSIIFFMLFLGNYSLFGGNNSLVLVLQTTSVPIALFLGSFFTVILVIICFFFLRLINTLDILSICIDGTKLMFLPVVILILAWILSDIFIYKLNIGLFLSNIVLYYINIKFLPAIIFFIAFVIAFFSGSAWGTAALLFPIVTTFVLESNFVDYPVSLNEVPFILFPSFGAILSGSVAGDHISPFSDTTVMTSVSCSCSHIEHTRTQMLYVIPFLFITFFLYLIVGFVSCINLLYILIVVYMFLLFFVLFFLFLVKKYKFL